MENSQIGDIFDEIADLIELQDGNPFRIRSYRNAARTVRDQGKRIEDMVRDGADLTELPNIGDSTAKKIHEILETGTCEKLKELHEEVPEGLTKLMNVPQLGPRKTIKLYKELGIESIEDLRKVCEEGKVRELEGFGEKSEQNLLEGIETLDKTSGRYLYRTAAEQVDRLARHLDKIGELKRWEVAGSFRRCKETIGDLDILVEADDRSAATEAILEYEAIDSVESRGEEKVTVYLDTGLQIDFRFFEDSSFGAAMMYFTGSKAHNIAVRKRAVQKDWKLNEYGLMSGEKRLAGKTEEAIYKRLAMSWVPPELREDRGEVEAAEEDRLPELVNRDEIRGDLQSHTNETDGSNTIAEMAGAAVEAGYEYFAITDHSQAVSVANGMDEDRLRAHAEAIREVDEGLDDLWLMAGVEVDILKDGGLDLAEDVLEEVDWVMGSIHYQFNLSEEKMTERLLRGIRSGLIDSLAHPTVRIIGRREPIAYDMEKVFEACAENGVCIEINGQPDRLDLPDIYCKQALEAGVTFTLGTDAHQRNNLDFMQYAVNVARRGWLEKDNVLNTRTVGELREWLGND